MKKSIWKYIGILFFLSVFTLFRIVNVHFISHVSEEEGDHTHCELCDVILASQDVNPGTLNVFAVEVIQYDLEFLWSPSFFNYETSKYSITLPNCFHNKPPPHMLTYFSS